MSELESCKEIHKILSRTYLFGYYLNFFMIVFLTTVHSFSAYDAWGKFLSGETIEWMAIGVSWMFGGINIVLMVFIKNNYKAFETHYAEVFKKLGEEIYKLESKQEKAKKYW